MPCGRATSASSPPSASGRKPSPAAKTSYVLCFKSGGGLAREEIERDIDKALFRDLETKIIAKPLIPKLRRSYRLPDGTVLEVNHVDEGQPTEFWYAEVEYPTVEAARSWRPEAVGLAATSDDVTDQPGQSMGAYWVRPGAEGRKLASLAEKIWKSLGTCGIIASSRSLRPGRPAGKEGNRHETT